MGKRGKETRTIPATTTPTATTATRRDRLTPYFLGAAADERYGVYNAQFYPRTVARLNEAARATASTQIPT